MKFERLGNICTVRNGYAFKSEQFIEEGVPIIRISDINGNFVKSENAVRIKYDSSFENFKVTNGDLLIAMSGATTGKYGIYNSEEIGYQNQRVGCFIIKDKSILDNNYLLQSLKFLKPKIEKKAHGSGQPNISSRAIEDFKIPLPSLETQLHIANLLSKAENLITQRKESIALLDEFLKSTFLEMFGDPVRNEKGFPVSKIEEHCDVKGGKRIPKGSKLVKENTGYPYIKAGNIKNGVITLKELEYLTPELRKQLKRYTVEKGDVCITVVGVNIGDIGLVPDELHLANLTENANKLLIKNRAILNNIFLAHYLMSELIQSDFINSIKSTGVPKLALYRIENTKLLLPPIKLQNRFAQIVKKTEALKTQYQQSLQELENLYGALSQKAFKGELEFKNIPQITA